MTCELISHSAASGLSRILDRSLRQEPASVFLIGAGGSGKTHFGRCFRGAVPHDDLEVAEFDDSQQEFRHERWEGHVDEYSDRDSCIRHFLGLWLNKIEACYSHKKLILASVNSSPKNLIRAIEESGFKDYVISLVQPSKEVRQHRLANDETRAYMPRHQLRDQFDSRFAEFLVRQAELRGFRRVLNEDSASSILEIASKLLEGA